MAEEVTRRGRDALPKFFNWAGSWEAPDARVVFGSPPGPRISFMSTVVWTDGSCNVEGIRGRGGWAALIERDGTTEQLVGSAVDTTHNRMELTAVCEALEQISGAIEVRTDSKYIQKCFGDGWHILWRQDDKWRTRKGPVKNRDLWERLFTLVEDETRDVSWEWIPRSSEENNKIVDRLSREASKSHAEN
jgi:ribonuclease HI